MAQRKLQNLSDEQLYADWVSWIKRIFDEIAHLAWNRRVFRSVGRVFEKNPHLQERGGFLWEWMRGNYIAGAGMALRREVDRQYTANMRQSLVRN